MTIVPLSRTRFSLRAVPARATPLIFQPRWARPVTRSAERLATPPLSPKPGSMATMNRGLAGVDTYRDCIFVCYLGKSLSL